MTLTLFKYKIPEYKRGKCTENKKYKKNLIIKIPLRLRNKIKEKEYQEAEGNFI